MNFLIGRTCEIRLAVVGVPSSGKSYLLSDIVNALNEMGFVQDPYPLSYPHSSLGAFYYDISNNTNGCVLQTPIVACRTENHYGVHLRHPKSSQRIILDFLNIPGEAFYDAKLQLGRYMELAKVIGNIKKGTVDLTQWINQSGQMYLVVEPSVSLRRKFRSDDEYNKLVASSIKVDTNDYRSWDAIYSRLNTGGYRLVKRKSVSGKYLMKHFFELQTDSFFATMRDVWGYVAPHLNERENLSGSTFNEFYYLRYCECATDLIVCDKLFVPGESVCRNTESSNFFSMMLFLTDFLKSNKARHNVYLAFRGSDMMMSAHAEEYKRRFCNKTLVKRRKESYEVFVEQMVHLLENEPFDTNIIDEEPSKCCVTTGGDIVSHIRSRLGGDSGHAFRNLLRNTIREKKKLNQIQDTLPPNVYFTATPIDSDFRFYQNDEYNVSRFVCRDNADEDGKEWHAFNLEIARNNVQHLCFGTYQMLTDILRQDGFKN